MHFRLKMWQTWCRHDHGAGLWHFVTIGVWPGIAPFGVGDLWLISRFWRWWFFSKDSCWCSVSRFIFWCLFQLLDRCDLQPWAHEPLCPTILGCLGFVSWRINLDKFRWWLRLGYLWIGITHLGTEVFGRTLGWIKLGLGGLYKVDIKWFPSTTKKNYMLRGWGHQVAEHNMLIKLFLYSRYVDCEWSDHFMIFQSGSLQKHMTADRPVNPQSWWANWQIKALARELGVQFKDHVLHSMRKEHETLKPPEETSNKHMFVYVEILKMSIIFRWFGTTGRYIRQSRRTRTIGVMVRGIEFPDCI